MAAQAAAGMECAPGAPLPASGLDDPPVALAHGVRAFFWRDLPRCGPAAQLGTRVPPSPYPGIVWLTRGTARLLECGGQSTDRAMPAIALSGAHRHPYHSRSSADGDSFCLAFQPGALGLLTGQDLAPLTDAVADAAVWLPADWQPFLTAVRDAADHATRKALCAQFLTPRWAALSVRHTTWLATLRRAGWQRPARQATAAELGWTARHFQRRTRQLTGLRPGEIERMLRAEHALLAMRDDGAGALDAALRHGYADQAHFSREARSLYQRPPAALRTHVQQPRDDADWLLRRS